VQSVVLKVCFKDYDFSVIMINIISQKIIIYHVDVLNYIKIICSMTTTETGHFGLADLVWLFQSGHFGLSHFGHSTFWSWSFQSDYEIFHL